MSSSNWQQTTQNPAGFNAIICFRNELQAKFGLPAKYLTLSKISQEKLLKLTGGDNLSASGALINSNSFSIGHYLGLFPMK